MDDFILEMGDEELMLSSETESTIVEGLGLGNISDLELSGEDFVIDDDEITLTDESSEGLSDSLLLQNVIGIVETLGPYAMWLGNLMEAVTPSKASKESDEIKYALSSSEFPFMPEDVFRVFHKILVDLSRGPEYQNVAPEELCTMSLQLLLDNTLWQPKLKLPEYTERFVRWCKKFRRIAIVDSGTVAHPLLQILDMEDIKEAYEVFDVNTRPFIHLNNGFADPAIFDSELIGDNILGDVAREYMANNKLRALTLRDGYAFIQSYLTSDATIAALKLTRDAALDLSTGELLRRMLVYELESGRIYSRSLVGDTGDDISTVINCLFELRDNGSVSAELILIAGFMMTLASKQTNVEATGFLSGIKRFLRAYLAYPATVNPVCYEIVNAYKDHYELSYADGDTTISVEAPSVLCSVVGTRENVYCIPKVVYDSKRGKVVCPPPTLCNNLNTVSLGGSIRVNGPVVFSYTPTISWMASLRILATDKQETEEVCSGVLSGKADPMLQTLMNYDNNFDGSLGNAEACVAEFPEQGLVVYSVKGNKDTGHTIACVTDMTGTVLATKGVLHMSDEDDDVVVQYSGRDGRSVDFVLNKGDINVTAMRAAITGSNVQDILPYFIMGANTSAVKDNSKYIASTQRLCEIAGFDYAEELRSAKLVIARDLFHIVGISKIDELLASRVFTVYRGYIEQFGSNGVVDNFNKASVRELVDILEGRPNFLSDVQEWDTSLMNRVYEFFDRSKVTVQTVCNYLDSLDFNVLAMQGVSPVLLSCDAHMDAYNALCGIPAIGSRLEELEHKILVVHIFAQLRDAVVGLFSRHTALATELSAETTIQSIDAAALSVATKMKTRERPAVENVFSTCKKVMERGVYSNIVLKYLVLERNIYGLIKTMQTDDAQKAVASELLAELNITEEEFESLSDVEFRWKCSGSDASRLMQKFSTLIDEIVTTGILGEAASCVEMVTVKAFDLFNAYHDVVFANRNYNAAELDVVDLCNYGASFVISYCPVYGGGANDIDGGSDRVAAYVTNQDDYYYDMPLGVLNEFAMVDLRTAIGAADMESDDDK